MTDSKKEGAAPAATEEAPPRRNRRQLLGLGAAAAAGATAATLLPQAVGRAQAQVGHPLLIGEGNDGEDVTTGLTGSAKGNPDVEPAPTAVLAVTNVAGPLEEGEDATALVGKSEHGEGIHGITYGDVGQAGVAGFAELRGQDPTAPPSGPAAGVRGASGTGPGVWGNSQGGPGVEGHSHGGPGVEGHSESAPGIVGESAAGGVHGVALGKAFGVLGESWSHGVVGRGYHGVRGEGYSAEGGAAGVKGLAPGDAPGVRAASQLPGTETPDGGLALDVVGKARFSTAGSGVVPARSSAVTVSNPAVTADSHITVTFTGDPGRAFVAWVERQPGSFIVHLSGRSPRDVPFTYLIVEPGV